MFKWLPATEEEFDIEEVANATPDWLKYVMIGFVAVVFLSAIFI